MWILLEILIALVVLLPLMLRGWELARGIRRQPASMQGSVLWENKGPTPEGAKKFTPQGLTWVDGHLIFANTWKDTRSRVYRINPTKMAIEGHFDMPSDARHTSGLAWDGKHIWAADYSSNQCYQIDLDASFVAGQARVVGAFPTGLRGTSACCIVRYEGRELLAISDFMNSRKSLFVDHINAIEKGTARESIVFSYRNEGYSQGLEFDGKFIYESENKLGYDVINKIAIDKLDFERDSVKATVRQYTAPYRGIEDLAWDGEAFWTTDERSFCFYRGILQ